MGRALSEHPQHGGRRSVPYDPARTCGDGRTPGDGRLGSWRASLHVRRNGVGGARVAVSAIRRTVSLPAARLRSAHLGATLQLRLPVAIPAHRTHFNRRRGRRPERLCQLYSARSAACPARDACDGDLPAHNSPALPLHQVHRGPLARRYSSSSWHLRLDRCQRRDALPSGDRVRPAASCLQLLPRLLERPRCRYSHRRLRLRWIQQCLSDRRRDSNHRAEPFPRRCCGPSCSSPSSIWR